MENSKVFWNTYKDAEYLSKLFCAKCKITEENKNLITAYLTMMWAVDNLKGKKGCKKIISRLSKQCSIITRILMDELCDAAKKNRNK